MNKLLLLLLIVGLGLGFYFKVITFDPLSLVIMMMLVWNNAVNLDRQQQLADLIAKSHSGVVANQKTILKAIDNVRSDLRKIK